MTFAERCADLANTELYEIFCNKAGEDSGLKSAVEDLCSNGAIEAKSIITFFPTFTLHDSTHIAGVCRWMVNLLGDKKDDLTAEETAVLLIVASCHDLGMSVTEEEKAKIENLLALQVKNNTLTSSWSEHFRRYPGDEIEYSENKKLTDSMLRRYIRDNHHERIGTKLKAFQEKYGWSEDLDRRGITYQCITAICKSHGESLPSSGITIIPDKRIDFNLCAVLLRLADLLDYDALRAPKSLFLLLGLDKPEDDERKKSRQEWKKNGAGRFDGITDRRIRYSAKFTDPQTEHEVQSYLDWTKKELLNCESYLSRFAGRWENFRLPYKIDESFERDGYSAGDFQLTMDQDKIIKLLAGENLYSDPGVFVRELLQNAIDAVLERRRSDIRFGENDGLIVIRTWVDDEGYYWFRIEDNGIGMDEHIIKDYFLKVGRSYYTSEEYKAALLHSERNIVFRPTSRFGIGILSCFMSDPDGNKVEIVTRRFSSDKTNSNSAIRLNISGLHGYYYLTKTDENHPGQPMHRPGESSGYSVPEENDSYLRETGTTVCVRINRFRVLGKTFKEIMDRYTVCPEVTVKYYGPEAPNGFTYPTEWKLTEALHRLNEGMTGIEPVAHIHPLPDKQFDDLKKQMPHWNWSDNNRPQIVMKYYPLDTLSGSGNTFGAVISADLKYSDVTCIEPFEFQGEIYQPKLERYVDVDDIFKRGTIALSFDDRCDLDPHLTRKIELIKHELDYERHNIFLTIYPEETNESYNEKINLLKSYSRFDSHKVVMSMDELMSLFSEDEKRVFNLVVRKTDPVGSTTKTSLRSCTAYNGVLADASDLIGEASNVFGTLILLKGDNLPQVDLARNVISALPLEAMCDLAIIQHKTSLNFGYNKTSTPFLPDKYMFYREQDFFEVLRKHNNWEEHFDYSGKSLSELNEHLVKNKECDVTFFANDFFALMRLAALKQRYTVYCDFEMFNQIYVSNEPPGNDVGKFPCSLFFVPKKPWSLLGNVNSWSIFSINAFNCKHRFSRWLIEKQKDLIDNIKNMYEEILRTMLLENDKEEFINRINDILRRLKGLPGNPFDVTEELFLSENEII